MRYTLHRASDGVAYDEGRGSLVADDGWSVSYESLSRWLSSRPDDGKVTLNLRHNGVPHVLNGTKYTTQEEASRAAYAAGALAWMTYDTQEA